MLNTHILLHISKIKKIFADVLGSRTPVQTLLETFFLNWI